MPKKTRKKKKGKKIKKRKPAKKKKKVLRKSKKRKPLRSKKRKTKSSVSKTIEDSEKIYKTKSEWIKKALVTKNPNAVFYGNNELEKFIADSLVDKYGKAFSELIDNEGVHNEVEGHTKTILMLKNGEKLDENEISILRSLSEKDEPEKNNMIIFFNIGISAEKVKQKIDKFGDSLFLYDAQDITIQEDETDVDSSHDRELKKPIHQTTDDIPSEKKELGVSKGTSKYKTTKIKIILLLLVVGGFLLSFEDEVQTKILEIINSSSSGQRSFSLTQDFAKRDFFSAVKNKFSVICPSAIRSNRNSYESR